MRRVLTVLILPCVLMMTREAGANAPPYGWTLTESTFDPFQNTGVFFPGLLNVNLWYVCSTSLEDGGPGGMSAAQFSIINKNPANIILSFTPVNGFLNAGPPPTPTEVCLLLAVGGCPVAQDGSGLQSPMIAGNILVLMNAPGAFGLAPCDGTKGTVDCSPNPSLWPIQWIGYSNDGTDPQMKDWTKCEPKPTSVDESSWGRIKGQYR